MCAITYMCECICLFICGCTYAHTQLDMISVFLCILHSISHTTRPQTSGESHGREYYFIDTVTFQRAVESVSLVSRRHEQQTHHLFPPSLPSSLSPHCSSSAPTLSLSLHTLPPSTLSLCQGDFLETSCYGGHWYGLAMASLERVAQQGLACITHMSLEVGGH